MISYSIAIRTLGNAGEKYQKLLDSIARLNIQPEKIVVVLPEGYAPPAEKIGTERFVYSRKGMIPQRLFSLQYITSEYTLFCDDDVELSVDFIEKLAEPLQTGEYDCSAGPLLEFFPPKGKKYLLASVLGGACVMLHGKKNTYVRILKTGGWSYNDSIDTSSHRIYQTESLPWTCFFIRTEAMKQIHFEDEMWAEKNGYAAFEDRVMFYKLKNNGYHTCVVSDAKYLHNDAKTSTKALRTEPVYAAAYNHYVFWYRHIYQCTSNVLIKGWEKLCIRHYIQMQKLYQRVLMRAGRSNAELYAAMKQGFQDAKKYVKSVEYKRIPSAVIKE